MCVGVNHDTLPTLGGNQHFPTPLQYWRPATLSSCFLGFRASPAIPTLFFLHRSRQVHRSGNHKGRLKRAGDMHEAARGQASQRPGRHEKKVRWGRWRVAAEGGRAVAAEGGSRWGLCTPRFGVLTFHIEGPWVGPQEKDWHGGRHPLGLALLHTSCVRPKGP